MRWWLLVLAGCGADAMALPDTSMWCGNELCEWKIARGAVEHAQGPSLDSDAARLASDGAAIGRIPSATDCFSLAFASNVTADATLFVDVDVGDDQRLELHEQVPANDGWRTWVFPIEVVGGLVRFQLAKSGDGDAMISELVLSPDHDCAGLPALRP